MTTPREIRTIEHVRLLRAASTALVDGVELDQLFYVVLAGVAHPHGLDYDRAFLFLADESGRTLRLSNVIGPHDEEEAHRFREALADATPDLSWLLHRHEATQSDPATRVLAQRLTGFEVPVSASAPPINGGEEEVPVHALVAHCTSTREPFYSNALQAFFQPPPASGGAAMRFSKVACVPLRGDDGVLGVLLADNAFSGRDIQPDEIEALAALGNLASAGLVRARLQRRLEESVHLDGMTGVYNRRYFESRLVTEIDRARRAKRPLALLLFHILDFKTLNENHGYEKGDLVLRDLANFLKEHVRTEDVIARYGQDEFLVLLTGGATREEALRVGDKLREKVPSRNLGGLPLDQVQIRAGLVWQPHQALESDRLHRLVEEVLEQSKRERSDRVVSNPDPRA